MTAKILVVATFCVLVFGCKKNDNNGKIKISIKSISATIFNFGDQVTFVLEVTHPTSGDTNDSLLIRRKFLTCPFKSQDSIKWQVPEFYADANVAAEYEYKFSYGSDVTYGPCSDNGSNPKTDSAYYTFILIDKNGNRSDSVVSPKIILKKG